MATCALPHFVRVATWHMKRVGAALIGRGHGFPLKLVLAEIRGIWQIRWRSGVLIGW
jgi:hypothetical protein